MSKPTAQQERLQDDLRGLIDGEVRCDAVAIQAYTTDAGLFECSPLAVVFPRSKDDVVSCVQYAAEHQIPLHPRGAGTGRTGACLGHGIVLDFTRYMRRTLQVFDDSVVIQPGAVLERVNRQLERSQGRLIGPDPGYAPTTTVGSMLASNGAGPHWLKYGFPSRFVRKLQVVLAGGETVTLESSELSVSSRSKAVIREIVSENDSLPFSSGLRHELTHYFSLTSVSKTVAALSRWDDKPYRQGYRIADAFRNGEVDLMPLLLGSEGTLGIITQAEIATVPKAKASGIVLFLFDRLDDAMRSVPLILTHKPVLCELIDRRRLNLVRDWDHRYQSLVPPDAEAVLAIEIHDDDSLVTGDRMHDLVDEIRHDKQLCFSSRAAFHENDLAMFRDFIAKSQFALYRMPNHLSGISRFEDAVVPVGRLSDHLVAVQNIFKKHEMTPSFFGHVGQGQLSVQPVLNLSAPDSLQRLQKIIPEYFEEVIRCEGAISSEQPFGFARSPFVRRQFDKQYHVYEQVKRLFDPRGLLNPGKIIVRDDLPPLKYRSPVNVTVPAHFTYPFAGISDAAGDGIPATVTMPPTTALTTTSTTVAATVATNGKPGSDLTASAVTPIRSQLELQLKWDPTLIHDAVLRCNGCGRCRSRMPDTRMCPVFRRDPNEEVAPRAKPNLMRNVIDDREALSVLTSEQSKAVADHCIHCHICRIDCPTEVDMPNIAFQSKCAFAAAHGLSLADRFLSHLDQILKWVNLISCPVNWSRKNRLMRWLYEKIFGLSQSRKLPRLAKMSFLARTIWYKRLSKPSRRKDKKVALFVDLYTNYFEPRIADAAVKVLEHNGIDVYVPGRQQTSGVLAIACGHRDRVEKLARHNTALLADVIRQGYHVVTLEPASAVCLKNEYGYVVDDADSALVQANTSDISTYLHHLHKADKLQLDFLPIHATVGYHAPCRSLVQERCPLSEPTAAEQLLRLIPGLAVKRLEQGCCGLAGIFGLQAKTFRMSLRIGMPLFGALRDPAIKIGSSECNLCKMQMEQGCNKPALHPVVLLAHAYGFLPEIAPLLKTVR
ncbi:MAG: FAD-binding protein [Planctomycetaceae bacterium]|nr:FAD-binding protein [Planctomycetaceae bacterium]